jgi:hypothetical protein
MLTSCQHRVSTRAVTTKLRMAGLRADERTIASWSRKAKAAGMSFNKWAHLVLNSAPDVKPAAVVEAKSRG